MTKAQIQYYHTLKLKLQIATLTRKSLNPYARQCIIDLVRPDGIKERSMCERFANHVRMHVVGNKYGEFHRGTARDTALALAKSPFALRKGEPLQDGDFLYDYGTPENMGHVVIVLPNHWYGNNSSIHWDGVDSRGMRKDYTYKYWDLAVRFPNS